MSKEEIKVDVVTRMILVVRGVKVILDSDLAVLYGVKTKNLNLQIKRNRWRFPGDFMFQLTKEETLRLQNATSKRGGRRYFPYVFTEQGVAMLSSVLNSERAIQVNIAIIRAFVKLRQFLSDHKELTEKLKELERKYQLHETDIQVIFEAIRKLIEPPDEPPKPRFNLN